MKNTERPRRPRTEGKEKPVSSRSDQRSDKKSYSDDKRPYASKKTDSAARPKGNFPKKEGFERSFSEPRFGEKRSFGAKKPFAATSSDRPFERKATDDKRPYGEKKSFGSDRPARPYAKKDEGGFESKRPYGEKKSYGSDRPARPYAKKDEGGFESKRPYGEKKSYGDDRPARPYVKKEDGGFENKRPYGERKSYGDERPARPYVKKEDGGFENKRPYGEKKSYSSDRPDRPFQKRTEGGFDKKSGFGDRKPATGDRPERPFFKKEEGGFENKRTFGDKKPFGTERAERPSFRREGGDFAEKKPFDREKPRFEKRDDRREERGYSRGARDERKENQASASKVAAPNYNLDKMKNSLPPRVKRKVEQEEKDIDGLIRLNRYISNAGIASRRDADELIASGQITVNGKEITEMGYKVKPSDVVKYGKKILNREKLVYLLLNKPKDFITTTEDPNERKTVMDLVANACEERVYPVGRLDRNTTGLLLLTNDGELAEKLSHPSNEIRKIYQVELDKPISTEHFDAIKEGIDLEDGFIKADDLALVTPDAEVVGIEIHSGKNRIVRRIFEHFGYEVLKLDRTTYAGLNKKDLPRGKWRFLTEKEVIRLKYMI
ncbi:pseudouridine synthase [Emticicia sp. 21SJ11W-3]|uniref:pseudouridine synthase n=1 Tax=Emticicia sp. 21SJ11W-3 TaxID=2916755 RepID=UPI00209E7524|nr:pseudouridine synthase [Emticicia sp. 21SJ11W-3]UTA67437.1 rRNA pseudouridine synthase [Emticicia sp. 21SJ11W-3]